MEKVSQDKIAQVLAEVGPTLRKLASERDELQEKVAQYERRERAMKVASAMHEKGVNTDQSLDKLASHLEELDRQGKLETVAEAIDLVGPDMGSKIATLTNTATATTTVGPTDFERYLNGGI